jgi:hypothetical protein
MWMQQLPSFLCVGAVPGFAHEFACFRKEVKNGLYTPFSYFLANTCVNIPFWFVLTFTCILPAFILLDLNWQQLPAIWLLISCHTGWSDTVAQLCGTLIPSTTLATMIFVFQFIVNMVFTGTLLAQVGDVPWWLSWLYDVVPAKFSFRSGILLEFQGHSFEGFGICLDWRISIAKRARMACWGVKGVDVITQLKERLFPVLSLNDTFQEDLAFILGELLILKIIHMVALCFRVR